MSPDTGEHFSEIRVDQERDAEDRECPANTAAAGFQNQYHQNHGKYLIQRGNPLKRLVDDGIVNDGHIDAAGGREDGQEDVVPRNPIQILVLAHWLHNEYQRQHKGKMHTALDNVRKLADADGVKLKENQRHRQSLYRLIPKAGQLSHEVFPYLKF